MSLSLINEEQLLSPAQVSQRLGVSRSTVYGLIARGVLPAARIGRQHRVSPDAIDRLLRTDERTRGDA